MQTHFSFPGGNAPRKPPRTPPATKKRQTYVERKRLYVPQGSSGVAELAVRFSLELNQVISSIQTLWRLRKSVKVYRSICIEGSNRINPSHPHYAMAFDLAKKVGELGFDIVCGAKKDIGINQAARLGGLSAGTNVIGVRVERDQGQSDSDMTQSHVMQFPHTAKVIKDYFCDAHVFFPGGLGTLDMFFETLTLQQTAKTHRRPIVCIGSDYWNKTWRNFLQTFINAGTISRVDVNLIHVTDSVDEALSVLTSGISRSPAGAEVNERRRGFSPARNLAFTCNVHQELYFALEKYRGLGGCAAIYGSARTRPGQKSYDETVHLAEGLAEIMRESNRRNQHWRRGIVSGGGPGNMEAANVGAQTGGVPSIGLGIKLPHEQSINSHIDPGLGYLFDYFLTRKFVFQRLVTDGAILLSPTGGLGTLDELFEFAWHIQHRLITPKKILAFDPLGFWEQCLPPILDKLVELDFIRRQDRDIFVIESDLRRIKDAFARETGINSR